MITEQGPKKRVAVCDTQPITAEGLKNLLAATSDLEFLTLVGSLEGATATIAAMAPDLIILDKGFGMRAVLDWIHDLKLKDAAPAPDCTMTSKPALVSFGTSPGTSSTRRSPRADSFGMLTIICADDSRGRIHLIVRYLNNRLPSPPVDLLAPSFYHSEKKREFAPGLRPQAN